MGPLYSHSIFYNFIKKWLLHLKLKVSYEMEFFVWSVWAKAFAWTSLEQK